MKSLLLTLTMVAVGASLALAEGPATTSGTSGSLPSKAGSDKPKHEPAEAFKKMDTNNDNSLSLDEFKAGPKGQKDPVKAEEIFKRKDKDGNGSLSLDEFIAQPGRGEKGDKGGKKKDGQ